VSFLQADATRLPFVDDSFDLVLGSPPYADARTYGIDAQRNAVDWVDFMLDVTAEACRVSRGLVLWVAAGVTRNWNYWPCCEGLMWEWFKRGNQQWRPSFWHRVGKRKNDEDPWGKRGRGNNLSGRNADGTKKLGTSRTSKRIEHAEDGTVKGDHDRLLGLKLANPGNLVRGIKVGGGLMGHDLAHENEAPFPLKLAQWFIRGWCPPGGIVLDPFSGSGTTVHAAMSLGRIGVGCDLRYSQCELGRRRCGEVQTEMF
jgi:DNA methylase